MYNTPTIKRPLPGDGLIFTGINLFDGIEKAQFNTAATHFEIYAGDDKTFTSKPERGVDLYDLDLTGIYRVIRPLAPFDHDAALVNFERIRHLPYGFEALLRFEDINIPDRGIFCSEAGTLVYRSLGIQPFNWTIMAGHVAPAHYLIIHESVFKIEYQR